jgi:Arc/MetJ-type ribon-helix-helix transcriptional regulator
LIRELRDLQEVVSRIKNFTLGQSMVETARSLIQQGAYDQAREVIDKLRLYLKEW